MGSKVGVAAPGFEPGTSCMRVRSRSHYATGAAPTSEQLLFFSSFSMQLVDPSDPSDVSIGNPTQNWVRYGKGIELSPPAQLRSVVFASKRPGQVDQVRYDGGDCGNVRNCGKIMPRIDIRRVQEFNPSGSCMCSQSFIRPQKPQKFLLRKADGCLT